MEKRLRVICWNVEGKRRLEDIPLPADWDILLLQECSLRLDAAPHTWKACLSTISVRRRLLLYTLGSLLTSRRGVDMCLLGCSFRDGIWRSLRSICRVSTGRMQSGATRLSTSTTSLGR